MSLRSYDTALAGEVHITVSMHYVYAIYSEFWFSHPSANAGHIVFLRAGDWHGPACKLTGR